MNSNKKVFLEMYPTIQGEGEDIGKLALLLRTFQCNLKCEWCDTKFSWNEKPKFSSDEAIEFIKTNPAYNLIIFSGGEPLLHQDEIVYILNTLESLYPDKFPQFRFIIETNCTIAPCMELYEIMQSQGTFSVSPKFHALDTLMIKAFDSFPNSYFKFVISDLESDISTIQRLYSQNIITKPLTIVQPNGNTPDYLSSCRSLCDYIISNSLTNLRPIPQFHKICWQNARGK
jgi:organic radical activating enzyme